MRSVEAKIAEFLGKCIKGTRPSGIIKCEATQSSVGYTGSIETGFFSRASNDFSELLRPTRDVIQPSFSELIRELRDKSVSEPNGPWYRCNIEVRSGKPPSFQYFWENTPFDSVKELEPNIDGRVPDFVFLRRFDKRLIDEISDFEVEMSVMPYVSERVAKNLSVSTPLMELTAITDWLGDVCNGAMDQYFSRREDWTSGVTRTDLYCLTYRGLGRIAQVEAQSLFEESLALYAHFHPPVETARAKLGIASIEKQETSDIMDRFYEMEERIRAAQVAYIRNHIAELEQS